MSVSFCYESINKSLSLFYTQFVLDLFFLFKQFQSHCVYKIFSYTKIKVYFKPQIRKTRGSNYHLKYCNFWFLRKNILSVIYPWDNFPAGQFSSRPFVRGAIMWATNHPKGNFPRGLFPGAYCQGAIIFGIIVREQ